jgi:hypothetical protein
MGEGRGVVGTGFWLGGPKVRNYWEHNIKMGLREIGIDGANWIQLAEDRVRWWGFVNMVINLRVP